MTLNANDSLHEEGYSTPMLILDDSLPPTTSSSSFLKGQSGLSGTPPGSLPLPVTISLNCSRQENANKNRNFGIGLYNWDDFNLEEIASSSGQNLSYLSLDLPKEDATFQDSQTSHAPAALSSLVDTTMSNSVHVQGLWTQSDVEVGGPMIEFGQNFSPTAKTYMPYCFAESSRSAFGLSSPAPTPPPTGQFASLSNYQPMVLPEVQPSVGLGSIIGGVSPQNTNLVGFNYNPWPTPSPELPSPHFLPTQLRTEDRDERRGGKKSRPKKRTRTTPYEHNSNPNAATTIMASITNTGRVSSSVTCYYDGCDQICEGYKALSTHLTECHMVKSGKDAGAKSSIPCLWQGCGKNLKESSLFRHILSHSQIKFLCRVCKNNVKFSRPDLLRTHLKKQHEGLDWSEDFCDEVF